MLGINGWIVPLTVKHACAFRDSYEKFKKAGAEVIGISGDDPSSDKIISTNAFPGHCS